MLKAGTKLKVLHNGDTETITVGYCNKQLVIITQDCRVLSPAFFSQDKEFNIVELRTGKDVYHVIDLAKPYNTEMKLETMPDDYTEFHLSYTDGDIFVFASQTTKDYRCLKLEPNYTQADINGKIMDAYKAHMLLLAVYKCQSSPYISRPVDSRQYGLWWERDRIDMSRKLENNLIDLRALGFKKLVPVELTEFNEGDDVYMFSKYDRGDYLFPLYSIEYSIDELLANKVIAVLPKLWLGYQAFLKDFCEGSGCI